MLLSPMCRPGTSTFNAGFLVTRSVEAAYSGSHGVHLMGILEWDQLNPSRICRLDRS